MSDRPKPTTSGQGNYRLAGPLPAPTQPEYRPPPASRLPSWRMKVITCRHCETDTHYTVDCPSDVIGVEADRE